MSDPGIKSRLDGELLGWCGLAIASLALAGLFALLLALSRTPGLQDFLPWPENFFRNGLVAHVALSFVVWFLAVMAAMLRLSAPPQGPSRIGAAVGRTALAFAAIGTLLILVPTFFAGAEPSLNNYIPVIIDPTYYTGLAILAVGILLAVLRALAEAQGRIAALDPLALIARTAGLIFLFALLAFALALSDLAAPGLGATGLDFDFNERLMWGGGHILQFLNLALLLAAWAALAEQSLGAPLIAPAGQRLIAAVILVLALPGLVVAATAEASSATYIETFTDLQYLLAVPVLLFAWLAWRGWRASDRRPWPWADPGFLCLVLSAGLFALGAVFGLVVDGADTRTPAHYHGVIGGMNLAFMGLFFVRFLPALGRAASARRLVLSQIILYAAGQTLFVIGMFWAGSLGAARKVTASAEDITTFAEIAARGISGLGGVVAVIGGILFIWTAAACLTRKPVETNYPDQ